MDFVAKDVKTGKFFEVQVKSIRPGSPICIEKDKLFLDEQHLICFLYFKDGEFPIVYIIPATAWKTQNKALVERNYDKPGQNSTPEWAINYSKKNVPLLEKYKVENYFSN